MSFHQLDALCCLPGLPCHVGFEVMVIRVTWEVRQMRKSESVINAVRVHCILNMRTAALANFIGYITYASRAAYSQKI